MVTTTKWIVSKLWNSWYKLFQDKYLIQASISLCCSLKSFRFSHSLPISLQPWVVFQDFPKIIVSVACHVCNFHQTNVQLLIHIATALERWSWAFYVVTKMLHCMDFDKIEGDFVLVSSSSWNVGWPCNM